MSVFECNVKVGQVGYFVIGEGDFGKKYYGDDFISINVNEAVLTAYENMGYTVVPAYTSDTIEEFIR